MVILASSSPRRSQILNQLGIEHRVISHNTDENNLVNETIIEYVKRLSTNKALDIAEIVSANDVIVGADTMVVLNGEWLGKPINPKSAEIALLKLSGKVHEVYTGFTILRNSDKKMVVDYELTKVYFKTLSKEEILAYIETKEPFDKAGGYGFQGFGARFIYRIEGCFYNVMGLPASKVYGALKEFGF